MFTMIFALFYGLLTDGFLLVLNVKAFERDVDLKRLVVAMTLSTTFVGLVSYFVSKNVLGLFPNIPALEGMILIAGVMNGVVGGYLTGVIWRKGLLHRWGGIA
jgi:hypothetical protein